MAGDLSQKGRHYVFKDKSAKKSPGIRDGLAKVFFFWSKDRLWRFKTDAFADLSAAGDPEMTISVLIGSSDYFEATDTFDQKKNGFKLKRLPLP